MEYLSPTTVEEAAEVLAARPDAKVFAGATDVIPQIRAGRPEPGAMVDLKKIERLVSVNSDDQGWTIGAATNNLSGIFFGRPISQAIVAFTILTLVYPLFTQWRSARAGKISGATDAE